MEISFKFLKQLLELLTSDWQDYLNKEINKFIKQGKAATSDSSLKLQCYKKIADINNSIKKQEYPTGILPFIDETHTSFLLTNIHILEFGCFNLGTVKAIKNMLKNNFEYIFNPQIYIVANYDEATLATDYKIIAKIIASKVITFEDFNIRYEDHTQEELDYVENTIKAIRKLDIALVKGVANIINFIHQIYFVGCSTTESIILFIAAHFDNLKSFYKNLDKMYFSVPIQDYDSKHHPKNYNDFTNIEAVIWNKFLIKYKELFAILSETNYEILLSICSDNDDFIKLLISDSINLDLKKRIEIITSVLNKYGNNAESICHITTQIFNICNTTNFKNVDNLIEHLDKWQGLQPSWCLEPDNCIIGDSSKYI